MATGTYFDSASVVDKTAIDTFIPEIWSDEVIAAYKKKLKMAPLCRRIAMQGKKGDVIHIPKPTRGTAFQKAEATAVTTQADTEGELTITINRHYEYSRLIEDIVDVQALASHRKFYTDDAGYALAKQVDDDLFAVGTGFGNGTLDLTADATGAKWVNSNVYYNDGGTSLLAYAVDTVVPADVFSDAAFRALIQKMDEADVPMDDRVFVIPPTLRNVFMGTERYVSEDFRNEKTVASGYIGTGYGIDIYTSTNCPVLETAASNSASTADTVGAFLMHKDAIVYAEQMGVRSQTQYKQEYLSTLYTADMLYGVQAYRPEAGFILAVPNV